MSAHSALLNPLFFHYNCHLLQECVLRSFGFKTWSKRAIVRTQANDFTPWMATFIGVINSAAWLGRVQKLGPQWPAYCSLGSKTRTIKHFQQPDHKSLLYIVAQWKLDENRSDTLLPPSLSHLQMFNLCPTQRRPKFLQWHRPYLLIKVWKTYLDIYLHNHPHFWKKKSTKVCMEKLHGLQSRLRARPTLAGNNNCPGVCSLRAVNKHGKGHYSWFVIMQTPF